MPLSAQIAAEVKAKIAEASKIVAGLEKDVSDMERAGIAADFQKNELARAKMQLEKLRAVYG